MSRISVLSISLGAALALAPAVSSPAAAQDAPACTGPQAVELRSIDLTTGTGRAATIRGMGVYAHCSWTTDATGRASVQLPLEILATLDGSTAETCSLPVVAPAAASPERVVVEVLLVDPAPAVEGLLIWRGTTRSASRVPSWAERVCDEARRREASAQVASSAPLPEVGWGIPGLDEIEALVRGSAEVQTLLAQGAVTPAPDAYPTIVRESSVAARQGPRIILLDPSDASADATRHIHLTVREASPTTLQVGVDAGDGSEIELRWTRSAGAPDWTLTTGI